MKKILKWMAAVLLAAVIITAGTMLYSTKYKVTALDQAVSPDGEYTVLLQQIGEPDFPFGYTHARLVLKNSGHTVVKTRFDAANDGAPLCSENWSQEWKEDYVEVVITAEEQEDAVYTLRYDGKE